MTGHFVLLLAAGPAFADSGVLPDPEITPGAVRTADAGAICSTPTRGLRHWNRARDDRILAEYGLPAEEAQAEIRDDWTESCRRRFESR